MSLPPASSTSAPFVTALVLAADHGGFALKEAVKAHLAEHYPGITVTDTGCYSSESVEYPNIVANAVAAMAQKDIPAGLFFCGSGAGVCMGANRYPHLRAILAHDISTAYWSRLHNDANVLCLGGRVVSEHRACEIVDTWLATPFEGGRHCQRVDGLAALGKTSDPVSPQPSACGL